MWGNEALPGQSFGKLTSLPLTNLANTTHRAKRRQARAEQKPRRCGRHLARPNAFPPKEKGTFRCPFHLAGVVSLDCEHPQKGGSDEALPEQSFGKLTSLPLTNLANTTHRAKRRQARAEQKPRRCGRHLARPNAFPPKEKGTFRCPFHLAGVVSLDCEHPQKGGGDEALSGQSFGKLTSLPLTNLANTTQRAKRRQARAERKPRRSGRMASFRQRQKRSRSKADFAPTWCR